MILVDLAITDYKQFAGTHRFTPSPNGLVAVIGTNGAGKTTLFEAIEWCLFQPREIPNAEVPPRVGTGPTRVVLTLMDPHGGDLYTIERRLRNGIGQAEIARGEGDAREVIVTGTRPVTEYVWRTLIGLDHRAFVATFFTRQKELSFFGDSRPTERRREVQRLLGLETIRKAQESLAEERRRAAGQAEALLAQVDETTASRDFEAELAAVAALVATAQQTVSARRADVQREETAHQQARRALEQVTELQRRDTALATDLARLAAEIAQAARASDAAGAEIARLDDLAATRADVERLAATVGTTRQHVEELESLRGLHERLLQARREVESARRQLTVEIDEVQRLVTVSPLASSPAWAWTPESHVDPTAAIDGLLGATGSLSVGTRERHLSLLEAARLQARQLAEAEAEVARIRTKLDGLRAAREEHFSSGDPADEIAEFDRREREIDTRIEQQRTTIRLMTEALGKLGELAERLAARDFSGLCPSCGRPFTEHDARTSEDHARLQLNEQREHIDALQVDIATLAGRRELLAGSRAAAEARRVEIATVTRTIEKGDDLLVVKRETVAQLQAAVGETLAELGRSSGPSEEEIAEARAILQAERAVLEAAVAIRSRRGAVVGHLARAAEGEATLADLGEVAFDPSALASARERLQGATSSAARLAEIDLRLSRRPEFLTARDESARARAVAEAAHVEVEAQRAVLDFRAPTLSKARMALDDAVEDERNARSRLSAAEVEHQAGVGRAQQVEREREAFRAVAQRADERARERDVLDEMVKEFNGFDRFVTQRVRPQMEDLTSELVRIVTDDKYQEVSLDDDYGVHVVAGGLDRFPLEQFSGGERDVVALCARLALSRIIGAQAVNPPRFLVLDEVFGSLDRERRLSLLEMLSNLAGSADVFQQLFVISHLDDVRTSSAFNEVWRVVEQGDGSSRLENLNLTGGAEEL